MSSEQWREIPGFPSYVVSDAGRVMRVSSGKILKAKPSSQHGYMSVGLSEAGKTSYRYIHRLVLMSFVGEPPSPNHQVAHNNGDHLDNRVENLRWATRLENAADKYAHGRSGQGERNSNAKLTEDSVRTIRSLSRGGFSQSEIAKIFGVTIGLVWMVVRNKTWKHVT